VLEVGAVPSEDTLLCLPALVEVGVEVGVRDLITDFRSRCQRPREIREIQGRGTFSPNLLPDRDGVSQIKYAPALSFSISRTPAGP
jgi:hypothetical protein